MTDPTEITIEGSHDTDSETAALQEILVWSKDCPTWQRDALRRLCTTGDLSDADIRDLTSLCKARDQRGIVLAAEHIPDPQSVTATVNLRAIRGAENINALKDNELLTFDKQGLTVIYGDNGSGKSGYVRVLKNVCRARMPRGDGAIVPNIYSTTPRPQKAIIDFSVGGQHATYCWTGQQERDMFLDSISVFDSRTANVHVNSLNDVAYTPFPMLLLEKLVDVCQKVKESIKEEIRALDSQTPEAISNPQCDAETAVGKVISQIDDTSSEQAIVRLATLSETDRLRLQELKHDLQEASTTSASRLDTVKNRLDTLTRQFERLEQLLTEEKVNELVDQHRIYQSAVAAAKVAASNAFATEPLPNIGSEVWRALWEAARRYSEQQVYPEKQFPHTENGARCVLCQQSLDSEAAQRLERFEDFIKDTTKRKEEEAHKVYKSVLDELKSADVPIRQLPQFAAVVANDAGDQQLARSVRRAAVTIKWRLRSIRREHLRGNDAILAVANAWPSEAVRAHCTALCERIKVIRSEDNSDERNSMRAELKELEGRVWLSVVKDDVLSEVWRKRRRTVLGAALKDTATNRITLMSDSIAERLVTQRLRAQFSKEVGKLGLTELAIELSKVKASYGGPRFRVSLERNPDVRVGEILSEGEHRCVALAAFLAELAATDARSAIVFDDPVSSLDHMHREAVADRLAEESHQRQVIVLTHDIAFLFLLEQACREKNVHVAFRSVIRTDEHAGLVQQDPPVRAQTIGKILSGMQSQLDNERVFYENGEHNKWERTVDSMQKRLRATWERAVEEAISPVVRRLSNRVDTRGLGKVTVLTMEDCVWMREAYGRCSTLLHSSANTLNLPIPGPDVIQHEISTLQDWVESVKDRQKEVN